MLRLGLRQLVDCQLEAGWIIITKLRGNERLVIYYLGRTVREL